MSLIVLTALAISASVWACSDDGGGGGGPAAAGEECEFGPNCADGLYCILEGGIDEPGVCKQVPAECSVPGDCGECMQLTAACPGPNTACSNSTDSDFNVTGNPTVTCN